MFAQLAQILNMPLTLIQNNFVAHIIFIELFNFITMFCEIDNIIWNILIYSCIQTQCRKYPKILCGILLWILTMLSYFCIFVCIFTLLLF